MIIDQYIRFFKGMDITVVVGYKAIEIIQLYPNLNYVYNSDWQKGLDKFKLEESITWELAIVTKLNKFSADVSKAAQDSQVEMASYGAEQRDSVQKFQEDLSQYQTDLQKYTAEVGSKVQEFQSKMAEAKKSLEQATIRLQLSSQYQQKSQDKFQKYSALYQAALRELAAVTGASAAPPQQQGAQRGEEGKST